MLNPVRQAFLIYKQKHKQENWSHPSWDQTAALFAVRGTGKFWCLQIHGTPEMFLKPNQQQRYLRWHTRWKTAVDSPHAYMKITADTKKISQTIESLMIQPPRLLDAKGRDHQLTYLKLVDIILSKGWTNCVRIHCSFSKYGLVGIP
jgi:hypothetical protein